MSNKQYHVELTSEEREGLRRIVRSNKSALWKRKRAQCLLKLDCSEQGPGWIDEKVAEAFEVSTRSLENWRKQAATQGPMTLLERKPRQNPPTPRKLDGDGEARVVAIACSKAPQGRSRWSLRLLADKLVELEITDAISHQTVGQVLKKRLSAVA